VSLKFITSQFGGTGEKIRPGLIFMLLLLHFWFLPFFFRHQIECVLLRVVPGREYVARCRGISSSVIYMKTSSRSDDVRNEADKKEPVPLIFHDRMWMGLILSLAAPHSLCWSLSLSLHTPAFTGLSDYSQILQPVTNLQLTKCCRGIVSPLAPFMLL